MRKPPRVALIGAGTFGAAIGERLLSGGGSGVGLTVWNRSPAPARRLARRGATFARTPAECVQDADFVLVVLANGAVTQSVLTAALPGFDRRRPPIVVDASTSGRAAALACHELLAGHGVAYVDAAMSGSVIPARAGALVGLVGASASLLKKTRPLLDLLCRRVIHAGAVGHGQALKVVLNGVGAHQFIGFASMLALGEHAGLTRAVLVDAFTTGAFATPSYIGKKQKILRRDYRADFALALAQKDVALNVELQRDVGMRLPVVEALAATIEGAIAGGLGDGDLFGIERYFTAPAAPGGPPAARAARPGRRAPRRR